MTRLSLHTVQRSSALSQHTLHTCFEELETLRAGQKVLGERVSELAGWCFKLSQLKGILSGLKETFIKRYTVKRTNKAEIRPEEQSLKAESCQENLWNEIQLKGS